VSSTFFRRRQEKARVDSKDDSEILLDERGATITIATTQRFFITFFSQFFLVFHSVNSANLCEYFLIVDAEQKVNFNRRLIV